MIRIAAQLNPNFEDEVPGHRARTSRQSSFTPIVPLSPAYPALAGQGTFQSESETQNVLIPKPETTSNARDTNPKPHDLLTLKSWICPPVQQRMSCVRFDFHDSSGGRGHEFHTELLNRVKI